MQPAKEITRIIECPICKRQITIGLSRDFSGRLRMQCTQCKHLLLDWSANKTTETAEMNKQPTPSEHLALTAQYTPVNNTARADTSLRIVAPEQEAQGTHLFADYEEPSEDLKRVGEYKLQKKIGRGAMGVIYLGEHIEKPGKVAVKLLSQDLQKDKNAVERFLQEARVHSRLVHPNIVRIFDVGYCASTSRLYLVMEFVDGESLEKILATRGSISPRHSLKIAIAVGHALEHALEQHIIHRDLKPANIMIDRRTRRVKVADLGLGKIAEEKGATLSGQMMGTPYYMPPEQIRNAKEVDHRADIYALGATLYHMLTGRPPYSEYKGTLQIVRAKIYRDPIPILECVPKLAPQIAQIIQKSLARDVQVRYETPGQMLAEMQKALES